MSENYQEKEPLSSLGVIHAHVAENKDLLRVKTTRNDVLGVLTSVVLDLGNGSLLAEQELLVVRQHDDQWHVEDIRQPLGEGEGDGVADVHAVGARTATGVEEKGLALLVSVEDVLEFAVAEDDATAHEAVGAVARDSFEPLEEGLVDALGAELDNQLVVVDGLDVSMFIDFLFSQGIHGQQPGRPKGRGSRLTPWTL